VLYCLTFDMQTAPRCLGARFLHLPPKKDPRLFVKTFFGNKPVSDSGGHDLITFLKEPANLLLGQSFILISRENPKASKRIPHTMS